MGSVTVQQLIAFVAVGCVLLGVYNTIMAARKNHAEAKKERNSPVSELKTKVENHEARISALESDNGDFKQGQKAIVFGLQALLEHELHNGNAEQMEKASDGLNKWLIGRM